MRTRTPTPDMVSALYQVVAIGLKAHREAHSAAGAWSDEAHRATAEDAEAMLAVVLERFGSQARPGDSRA